MPELNEVQMMHSGQIMRKFIYIECPDCKARRWVILIKNKPEKIYCQHCANTNKNHPKKSSEERFWKHIDKNGPIIYPELGQCWMWTGGTTNEGYGIFRLDSDSTILSHRYSYFISNNKELSDLFILHKCDNPACVNPDHLFLGTQSDNLLDASSKLRINGENNSNNKLEEVDVLRIKERYKNKESMTEIYKTYSDLVSYMTIVRICHNYRWKYLEESVNA